MASASNAPNGETKLYVSLLHCSHLFEASWLLAAFDAPFHRYGPQLGPYCVRDFRHALAQQRARTQAAVGAMCAAAGLDDPADSTLVLAGLELPASPETDATGGGQGRKGSDTLDAIPQDVDLATVLHARRHDLERVSRPENFAAATVQPLAGTPVTVSESNVVLVVRVYATTRLAVAQEFIVLASQRLCELRDRLYCLIESNNVKDTVANRSSFLFIEDTFYDDTRHPEALRHSGHIRAWAQHENIGLGPFNTAQMQDTTFEELTVTLNKPYLYAHHGNCEHIITFTDIRGVSPDDERDERQYPVEVFRGRQRRKKCRICGIYAARHVTYNDVRAPENPCFFCEECFGPLHYTQQGVARHRFERYDYHHEE